MTNVETINVVKAAFIKIITSQVDNFGDIDQQYVQSFES